MANNNPYDLLLRPFFSSSTHFPYQSPFCLPFLFHLFFFAILKKPLATHRPLLSSLLPFVSSFSFLPLFVHAVSTSPLSSSFCRTSVPCVTHCSQLGCLTLTRTLLLSSTIRVIVAVAIHTPTSVLVDVRVFLSALEDIHNITVKLTLSLFFLVGNYCFRQLL